MKKNIILLSFLILVLGVIVYTYAFPNYFSLGTINLTNNSKIDEISKNIEKKYLFDEPTLEVSYLEKEVTEEAISAVSVIIGPPKVELDHSYYAYKTRYNEFKKRTYTNEDLPKGNNNEVKDNYKYYVIDNDYDSFEYEIKRIEEKRIISYLKIRLLNIYTYDAMKFKVNLEVAGVRYMDKSSKTGALEEKNGNMNITITMLFNNNKIKVLDILFNSVVSSDEAFSSTASETSSLVGNLTYNKEADYTLETQNNITSISEKYRKTIVSLITFNKDKAVTSNSTGFFLKKGIIVANFSWFENYLLGQDELVISNLDGELFEVDGIISLSKYYDIIVLKLTEEKGNDLGDFTSTSIAFNKDIIIALTSPKGIGVATNTGAVITTESDYAYVDLTISEGEVGSPVFKENGKLLGVINSEFINSSSSSISAVGLELSTISSNLNSINFEDIKTIKLDEIKEKYYFDSLKEIEVENNDYDANIYNKYMNKIDIKEVYKDSIASISTSEDYLIVRVKYFENNLISKKQYTNLYTMKLLENGFKEIVTNDYRKVFQSEDVKLTIMYETGYLVFIYSEVEL